MRTSFRPYRSAFGPVLLCCWLCFCTIIGFTQPQPQPQPQPQQPHPANRLDAGPINVKYLEHLVKKGIDSVRIANGLTTLASDSILYLASKHHSTWMLKNKRMTHEETEAIYRTAQARVTILGAGHYLVGENVLKTGFNAEIRSKKGKSYNGFTYGGLAHLMVMGWVNSPGHFKNIITPDFQVTAVTVAIDTATNQLYSCQKFAIVPHRYTFEESKALFPYSNYVPPPLIRDFSSMEREFQKHDHDWKLKHREEQACLSCWRALNSKPYLTLRYEEPKFILRVENSEYVKQMVNHKKDGFAVEIVRFEDYWCGNPEYFTKPSRRNGQCSLNGEVLEPLYLDDLYRGYKKRKINKDLKLLSYIIKADSVPFGNRFVRHKLERFSSEYFEITLGKLPKDLRGNGGIWQHNLVYIQDDHVCNIDYFTGYCGEPVERLQPVQALPLEVTGEHEFRIMKDSFDFELSFAQNKAEYTTADIQPLIDSLANKTYRVDHILIEATTSVEGDSLANERLQQKRAESIRSVFQERQREEIPMTVTTGTDWDGFFDAVKTTPKWKFLTDLDRAQLRDTVNSNPEALEFALKKGRKAKVKLKYSIPITDENLAQYVGREYQYYVMRLMRMEDDNDSIQLCMDTLCNLQRFAYQKVLDQKLDTSVLASLVFPRHHERNLSFAEHYFLFGQRFAAAYSGSERWNTYGIDELNALIRDHGSSLSPRFLYEMARNSYFGMMQKADLSQEQIQTFIQSLEPLKELYFEDLNAQEQIDNINYNLHMHLLNHVYIGNPEENGTKAEQSFDELVNWHLRYEPMSDSLVWQMARMAVFYTNNTLALNLMKPYRDADIVQAYALQLEARHPSRSGTEAYYQKLIGASNTMDLDIWCNLFLRGCGIPFQALDHEGLREAFCEKCQEKNEYLKSIPD